MKKNVLYKIVDSTKFILRFYILIFFPSIIFGQDYSLEKYESDLFELAPILVNGASESERLKANEKFYEIWDYILDDPKSIKYPFKSLTTFPIFTSKNKKLRIINWIVLLDNDYYQYHGLVQFYNSRNQYKVSRLIPISKEMKQLENIKLENNQWFGALYYQMEEIKRGKKKHYILLGWDGNDKRSNKKVVDVLTIGKELVFGAPIFRINKKRQNRFIIEYKEDASASMKFNIKEKRIVFSELIPLNEGLEGLYDFYVPDGSVNALELINGSFKLKKNIVNQNKVSIPKIKKIKTGILPN